MTPWTIADDGTIEARHAGRIGALSADVSAEHRALIAAAPALLAEARALVVKLGGMAVHPSHYAGLVAAIVAATVVEAPHHPDCPATDGFGCHCDELGPWEHEPLPAEYDDDYPIDEPPPLPSESDRAEHAWSADRIHNR